MGYGSGLSRVEARRKEVEKKAKESEDMLKRAQRNYDKSMRLIRKHKIQLNGTRTLSTNQLQIIIRQKTKELIDGLYLLATKSKNPRIRLDASKVLINKVIPDLRSTSVTQEQTQRIMVTLFGTGGDGSTQGPPSTSKKSTTHTQPYEVTPLLERGKEARNIIDRQTKGTSDDSQK